MNNPETQDTLAGLNTPQTEAVTHPGGALMVLAGAGSGKTRVLTRRLAHLLYSGAVRPEEVLAVTFTNKAAREMRDRVTEILGLDPRGAGRLWIGTFHGMSARLLRIHAEMMGYESDFVILDMGDQERTIKRLCKELNFVDAYWTPKKLANAFSRWKDDGIGPEMVGEAQVRFPRDRERVAGIFSQYQEALRRANAMDFGDLIFNCLKLWERYPEALARYQERFRHILVDEFQDTNRVQYDWIRAFAVGHGNLCVVGDDDQSIYSWRGARIDNILRFEEDFPGTKVVRLEQNYRSTGNILKAASHLIDHNAGRMGKTLWTEGASGSKLQRFEAENGEDEARWMAAEIRDICKDHDYDRVAVLVRAARQTRSLEDALNREMIPYHVVGGLKFLERAEIKDALAYLRLAYSSRDDIAFDRIINVPRRGLGPTAIQTIQETARSQNSSLFDGAWEALKLGTIRAGAKLQKFMDLMVEGGERIRSSTPALVLDYLLTESGYLESLNKSDREADQRENLKELRALLVSEESLGEFLERAALETDMAAGQEGLPQEKQVTISTLHAAKGLEFPVVFLVGMEEGLLPHKFALDEGKTGLEEERRLAYVGLTRARERLYLSHARMRRTYNQYEPAIPSRFLRELPADTIENRGLSVSVKRGVGWGQRKGLGVRRGRY
ncbi:MAG: UvrD-helicase domain-containing protein [Magnetococcales bacterium]|nr:UvrD-helicase domain-containing protein [Magnetococcales bacterium]